MEENNIPPLEENIITEIQENTPSSTPPNTSENSNWVPLQQPDMEALPNDLREFIQQLRQHVESHLSNNNANPNPSTSPQTSEIPNQENTEQNSNQEPNTTETEANPSTEDNSTASPTPTPPPRPSRAMIRFVIFYENSESPNNLDTSNTTNIDGTENQSNSNENGTAEQSTTTTPTIDPSEPLFVQETNSTTQQTPQPSTPSRRRQIRHLIFNMMLPLPSLGSEPDNFHSILNQLFLAHEVRGPPPVSKRVLERLEQVEVDKDFLDHESSNCPVCFETFELKTRVTQLPCKHNFHMDCLTPWFKDRNSCPLCRYELPVDDEEYEQQRKKRMAVRNIDEDKLLVEQESKEEVEEANLSTTTSMEGVEPTL